jgi:hypothetical protein
VANELTAAVEIVSRDEVVYDDSAELKLSRVVISREFTGEIEGTSAANLLLAQPGGGYMALERFTGTIGGRTGTAVFSHGRMNAAEPVAYGAIVAGSGTGELEGIAGTAAFSFEGGAAKLTITLAE